MEFIETALPGVILIKPDIFGDDRGYFVETWHGKKYPKNGLDVSFIQDNESSSKQGVLRGLHFQLNNPQGKLVRVVSGEILDVAVDVRRGSPNFGKWVGATLSGDNKHQLYIPPGFAHGFYTISDAVVAYKCTELYDGPSDSGVMWNDPDIGVEWPNFDPILSEKDKNHHFLKDAVLPEF